MAEVCKRCLKRPRAKHSKSRCARCLAEASRHSGNVYIARRRANVCVVCCGPLDVDGTRCRVHRDAKREAQKRYQAAKKARAAG